MLKILKKAFQSSRESNKYKENSNKKWRKVDFMGEVIINPEYSEWIKTLA